MRLGDRRSLDKAPDLVGPNDLITHRMSSTEQSGSDDLKQALELLLSSSRDGAVTRLRKVTIGRKPAARRLVFNCSYCCRSKSIQ